jgi:hypothetical protein
MKAPRRISRIGHQFNTAPIDSLNSIVQLCIATYPPRSAHKPGGSYAGGEWYSYVSEGQVLVADEATNQGRRHSASMR